MIINTHEVDIPGNTVAPEQIIAMLLQIDALTGQGQSLVEAVRAAVIKEQWFCLEKTGHYNMNFTSTGPTRRQQMAVLSNHRKAMQPYRVCILS
jgi:hypothetical protein